MSNPQFSAAEGRFRVQVTGGAEFAGDFSLPGDKSISHRSALIAALGAGPSRIRHFSSAADCRRTLACLGALGIPVSERDREILIEGRSLNGFSAPSSRLEVGNSGTTIRLLTGLLAGQPFTSEIGGDASIERRPMRRVIEPLTMMGAQIKAREGNFAPLLITGGSLRGIAYCPPVASAQVKSCVLLAGLFADGTTTVVEQTPTRDHTEIMLRECGIALQTEPGPDGTNISLTGGQTLRALGDYTVAGDLSSAAFFLVAAILAPGSEIRLRQIGINPSRTALIDVLRAMGAEIEIENQRSLHGEPVADLLARSSALAGEHTIGGKMIANLIDEIPILAIAATRLKGSLSVREAGELRVKESDRIRSIVDNLRLMGAEVEEFDDGMRITGASQLRGATVLSNDDHRIAMAFAIAGLVADGETVIEGAEAAAVSLPEFYDLLTGMGAHLTRSQG